MFRPLCPLKPFEARIRTPKRKVSQARHWLPKKRIKGFKMDFYEFTVLTFFDRFGPLNLFKTTLKQVLEVLQKVLEVALMVLQVLLEHLELL